LDVSDGAKILLPLSRICRRSRRCQQLAHKRHASNRCNLFGAQANIVKNGAGIGIAMETNDLIKQLAGSAGPVRRLGAPWRRAGVWLAISLPVVVAAIGLQLVSFDPGLIDTRLLIEQSASLLTAMTAAWAAFSVTIPGRNRLTGLVPLVPLTVWLAALGDGCLQDWMRTDSASLAVRPDWDCAPAALLLSILPAIAMMVMLRRGVSLVPRATLALGALAVAAIANFGLRMFHVGDVSIQILTWHVGGALLLAAIAGVSGRYLLERNPKSRPL
jgi:hypothetical protein